MPGTSGENLTWKLESMEEGYKLTISGRGDIDNYDDFNLIRR